MKTNHGIVVLAVVALCLLFSGLAFLAGHKMNVNLDRRDAEIAQK